MLGKIRIKEAESNVRNYLAEGLLKKTQVEKRVIKILLNNAKESLLVAEEIHNKKILDLWVIVCSYLLFHVLLCKRCSLRIRL